LNVPWADEPEVIVPIVADPLASDLKVMVQAEQVGSFSNWQLFAEDRFTMDMEPKLKEPL
jgi:hypothetical protein